MQVIEQLKQLFSLEFWKRVFINFFRKDGIDAVTVLAYMTLIGIVPFLAIVISVLSFSDAFMEMKAELIDQLLYYLIPTSTIQVEQYIVSFSNDASNLKGISVLFIVFTTLILLWTIDEKINQMWDTRLHRKIWVSLLNYLGVSLFGPLLLVSGFFVSSFVLAAPLLYDDFIKTTFTSLLPILFSFVGFFLLYRLVPTAKVTIVAAMAGALFATLEIELLKYGFGLYVVWFPTYSLVYGAFSVIPLFLLWLYLVWLVVIFNASVVYQLMKNFYQINEIEMLIAQEEKHGS